MNQGYYHGDATPPAWQSWLQPAAAIAASTLQDPMRQAGVLRAQLHAAIRQGRPALEIERLRARWEAAEHQAALATESADTQRAWNQVGQLAVVAGVGLTLAVGFYFGARVFHLGGKS